MSFQKCLHFFTISNPLCIRRNGSRDESLILLGIRDHLEALSVVDKIKVFEGVSTIFKKSRQIKNDNDDTIESIYEPISIEQLGTPKEPPKFRHDSAGENDSPILVVEPIYHQQRMMNRDVVEDKLMENITDKDFRENEKSAGQVIKRICVVSGISFDEMSMPPLSSPAQKLIKSKKAIDHGNEKEFGSLISQAIDSLLHDHPSSNSPQKIYHTGVANEDEDNGGMNGLNHHGIKQDGMTDPRKLRTLLK